MSLPSVRAIRCCRFDRRLDRADYSESRRRDGALLQRVSVDSSYPFDQLAVIASDTFDKPRRNVTWFGEFSRESSARQRIACFGLGSSAWARSGCLRSDRSVRSPQATCRKGILYAGLRPAALVLGAPGRRRLRVAQVQWRKPPSNTELQSRHRGSSRDRIRSCQPT